MPARAAHPRARAGARGSGHLRATRSCAIAPHGPSCSTRCAFVSTSTAVQRGDCLVDVLLRAARSASRSCGPVSGPSSAMLGDLDCSPFGCGPVRRDEHRHEPWRDARRHPRDVLADADEPGGGQVVLRAPEEPHLLASSGRTSRPASRTAQVRSGAAVHLLPERRQDDVGLREEQRQADVVDPGRCLPRACTPRSSLQAVPTVRPFRALRYDPAVAGPLDDLVAPPYDVISDDAARSSTWRAARTTSCI